MWSRPLTAATACALLLFVNSSLPNGVAAEGQDTRVSIEPRLRSGPSGDDSANIPTANFRVNSNLVLIPVNVLDIRNRQVLGLTREQFRVFDNNVEQPIAQFASDDAPVSVAIVFDASGSMGPKLKKSREAVAEIFNTANPDDEFALIQFNARVQRLVDFTDRTSEILNRILTIQSRGQTALLDAIYLAVNTMRRARHPRKAILLISDGGDNSSRYSVLETMQMVREADVQIFAVAIVGGIDQRGRSREEIQGPELLHSITEETGGRIYVADKIDDLRDAASEIGMTLRHQYLLGYSTPETARDGKYHSVTVKVEGAKGDKVFWRLGYYAPGR
jgi:Ca-activated chloride channel family protein